IGAAREADRADRLAEDLEPARVPALSRRECEVLRLVADGYGDRAIAATLVLSEHTVHRHVANILVKLGCPSRSAAVAEALRTGVL
ncbi:MAG TPA: helix-turn-helix transcriptional regulator, partial [Actinomycetospora sp.]|nr:helix-turn-helix transcriptional regulator [Actinomycetospora sp.]